MSVKVSVGWVEIGDERRPRARRRTRSVPDARLADEDLPARRPGFVLPQENDEGDEIAPSPSWAW